MLHLNLNGYTILNHTWTPGYGYMVFGSRRTGPGTYDYVVASTGDTPPENATHWGQGHYSEDFDKAISTWRDYTGIRALSEPDSLSGPSVGQAQHESHDLSAFGG